MELDVPRADVLLHCLLKRGIINTTSQRPFGYMPAQVHAVRSGNLLGNRPRVQDVADVARYPTVDAVEPLICN